MIECKGLRWVVSSAAEAETCGVSHNAIVGVILRNLLIAMGHPQLPTPIVTDNAVADGFVSKNIQLKNAKSRDMHLHWLRDGENQKQFNLIWKKRTNNGVDYFTNVNLSTTYDGHTRSRHIQDALNILSGKLNVIYLH